MKTVEIDYSKFPRINAINEEIKELEELVSCLNKRKSIIKDKENSGDEFKDNEDRILYLKTNSELAKVHSSIKTRKDAIKEYFDKVILPYKEEVFTNFDKLMREANYKAKKDKVLADVLNDNKVTLLEPNHEILFNHYIAIKNYLNPQKNRSARRKK